MATIAIGLDGANWTLLEEWLAEGALPNLERLIETGIGGTSESCLPPLTVPNWKCYATGKNPGKLGVFRFDRIDTESQTHTFHDATDFQSAELWDYLNDDGYTTGIVNKPSTYPPKSVDGFVVAGGPDASESEYRSLETGFTHPPDLADSLREELDYSVHPSPMISPSEKGAQEVDAILELIESRFEAAEWLLQREQPDFLHLTVFYNMALQHYFWRDEPVFRAWKVIDRNLARFMDDGHDLILLSDHGTCHVETVFYVNVWLEEHGYLTTTASLDRWLGRAGVTRERALSLAKRFGMVDVLSTVVPERVQKIVPWEEGVKRDRVLSAIDWEETRAVASTQGPLYLTLEPDSPAYEQTREELIDELRGLTHPETGDPIITDVHRGEEYYRGPYAESAPDLLLEQGPNVHTSDAIGPQSWHASTGVWKGGNMPNGLFLLNGPRFREGGLDGHARIVDLAPTILYAMDVAIPIDVDGTVLDVFPERVDDHLEYRQPLSGSSGDGRDATEEIEERLTDLGYLE
ncbi:alkaline phosphatase family protein [Natronobeatus ordinarius]|uniref:alkaline phosphatase family protein n=1 Tax=Natronobeatus ordinarius TaxID=2963433 RepID=UPI0020CF913B|nr:alkaline phosphatase family protein [Natronobeatus ordinarius]